MGALEFIQIRAFCGNHGIEENFVEILEEYEVIEIKLIDDERYLREQELPVLEKMLRLHQQLGINPEGLHAIYHLLEKVEGLQKEISSLREKLNRFED